MVISVSDIRGLSPADLAWLRSAGVSQMPRITRSEFLGMRPSDQMALARAGLVPVDDAAPKPAAIQEGQMRRSEWNKLSPSEQRSAALSKQIVDD